MSVPQTPAGRWAALEMLLNPVHVEICPHCGQSTEARGEPLISRENALELLKGIDNMTETTQTETETETETKTAVERLLIEVRGRIEDPGDDELELDALERFADDLAAAIELDKADALAFSALEFSAQVAREVEAAPLPDTVDPAVAALAVDAAHKRANEQALGILRPRIARLKVAAHKQSGEAERVTRGQIAELQMVVDALTPYEAPGDEPEEPSEIGAVDP